MDNPDISHVPAQEWEAMLTPEPIGWSGTWLHQVQDYAQETGSFAGICGKDAGEDRASFHNHGFM